MHDAASRTWTPHRYSDPSVVLDERSTGQLINAWGYLPKSVKERPQDVDVPGRLVAGCMFGFWANLLDDGSFICNSPRRIRADYDVLWRDSFKYAFPGAKQEAKSQRALQIAALPDDDRKPVAIRRLQQEVSFKRSWVHGVCKVVNQLRNRVAHHEPMINGFPLKGQSRRLSAAEGHEHCRMLARMLDRDFATWLDSDTKVPGLLAGRPQVFLAGAQTIPTTPVHP